MMTNEQTQLEQVVELQRQFWEELGNLEEILGVEIDGTADLSLATIESLLKGEPLEDDPEDSIVVGPPFTPRQSDPDAMADWAAVHLTPPDADEPDEEDRPTRSDDEVDSLTCAACADPANGRFPVDCIAEVAGVADCRAEVVTVAAEVRP